MNMPISRSDLADFASFLAIARHRSISRAGLELGISASALSHALKGLEARLGIRLVNRTTRSVTLTAAGEQLYTALTEPMAAIGEAIDDLNRFREGPSGRVRLNVPQDAATYLLAPVLPSFVERYPDVELEIAVSNRLIDVIEGGFDAGILPWVSLGDEPFSPEGWDGDQAVKAGVNAPQAPLEQGGEGSGIAPGSAMAGFFSAGGGPGAATPHPGCTAPNNASAPIQRSRAKP